MEEKIYKVVRYFDTYPDGVIKDRIDYQSAQKLADEYNQNNNRYLVTYEVIKM